MTFVFDCETIRLASAIAPDGKEIGWKPDRLFMMGVSWACSWDRKRGLQHYQEEGLATLARRIEDADLVVSFNGIRFDIPLLCGYMKQEIRVTRHCDLLAIIHKSTGRRYSLAQMAEANLPHSKTGTGGHAPDLFRSGRLDLLATYCQRDVELTRDLFFLAASRGWLYSPDGKEILCPVPAGLPQQKESAA